MATINEALTNLADEIRHYGGGKEKLTLEEMAEEIFYVHDRGWEQGFDYGLTLGSEDDYNAGYEDGYLLGKSDGYYSGYEDGEYKGAQAEYDRFWDAYQDYGNKTSYAYAFAGQAWTDETYNPKYPINATSNANALFVNNAQITDTKVTINLGTTTGNKSNIFEYATNLVTIRELTWDCDINFTKQFTSCKNLKNITFNGTITRDINMQWCPLTVESMLSIITHLKNYKNTEYEGLYILTLSEDCWNRLEAWKSEQEQGGAGWSDWGPSMKYYV